MKRSEMVRYMVNEYVYSHRGGMSEMTDEERMDYLLKKIEEAGMLPPDYTGLIFGWNEGYIEPPEWEQE